MPLLALRERLRTAETTAAALQSRIIALEGRSTILLEALGQVLELGQPKGTTLFVAALEGFEAWQEVSGYIEPGTSLDLEVRACLEEAFRLGVVAGKGELEAPRAERGDEEHALTPQQRTRRGHLRDAVRAFQVRADRNHRYHLERGEATLAFEHAEDSEWASEVLAFGFPDSMEAIAERAGR